MVVLEGRTGATVVVAVSARRVSVTVPATVSEESSRKALFLLFLIVPAGALLIEDCKPPVLAVVTSVDGAPTAEE